MLLRLRVSSSCFGCCVCLLPYVTVLHFWGAQNISSGDVPVHWCVHHRISLHHVFKERKCSYKRSNYRKCGFWHCCWSDSSFVVSCLSYQGLFQRLEIRFLFSVLARLFTYQGIVSGGNGLLPEEVQRSIVIGKQLIISSLPDLLARIFPLLSNYFLLRVARTRWAYTDSEEGANGLDSQVVPAPALRILQSPNVKSRRTSSFKSTGFHLSVKIIGACVGCSIVVMVFLRTTFLGGHCSLPIHFHSSCRMHAVPLNDWESTCPCIVYKPPCFEVILYYLCSHDQLLQIGVT